VALIPGIVRAVDLPVKPPFEPMLAVAGATGVIGRRLVPRLSPAGHEVVVLTRSAERAEPFTGADGVTLAVGDALGDSNALSALMSAHAPEVVINQLTAIPARIECHLRP
jgi:nucleoside-diphosphate-sugar epimerase